MQEGRRGKIRVNRQNLIYHRRITLEEAAQEQKKKRTGQMKPKNRETKEPMQVVTEKMKDKEHSTSQPGPVSRSVE